MDAAISSTQRQPDPAARAPGLKDLLWLATPIAGTNMLTMLMGIVDTIIVGQHSAQELAELGVMTGDHMIQRLARFAVVSGPGNPEHPGTA